MSKKVSYNLNETMEEKQKVTKLVLSHQNLEELPLDIGLYENLEELDISSNKISELPAELGLLTRLTKVVANFNQITDFPFCANLQYLDLSHNNISIVPQAIYEMPLNYLNLENNRIRTFVPKYKIPRQMVRELRLGNNKLTTIHGFIHYFKQLEILSLEHNEIRTLPKGIKNLINITFLDLLHNKIKKIPKEIAHLKELKKLHLFDNNIQVLPPEMIGLQSLHRLDLGKNKMKEFPDFLYQLPVLFQLNLSDNKMKDLRIRHHFRLLSFLNVSHNQIEGIAIKEGTLPSLRDLDISNNKIKKLPLPLIINLSRLMAANNQLKSISTSDFNCFQNMEQLHLKNNQINQHKGNFPKLKSLDLSRNPFKLNSLDLVRFYPQLEAETSSLSKRLIKTLNFSRNCTFLGVEPGEKRVVLFLLTKDTLPSFSDEDLFYAMSLGGKKMRHVLTYIQNEKGMTINKNRMNNGRLFLLGETHFQHPFFIDKLKKIGVIIVNSLSEAPTHIILGKNIPKKIFINTLAYVKETEVSFLTEPIFFDRYLMDKQQFKLLSTSPEMKDNLMRLLNHADRHNKILGLQLLLQIGVPKQKSWRTFASEAYQNAYDDPEQKKLWTDILRLNGLI